MLGEQKMNNRHKLTSSQVKKIWISIFIAFLVCAHVSAVHKMRFIRLSEASTINNGWSVTLNITEPTGTHDTLTFGEIADASNGKDDYDVPKPPSPQEPCLHAWFTTNLNPPYDSLWEDYRRYPDNHKVWNFSVIWLPENVSSTNVTISWVGSHIADTEYTSIILYHNNSIVADMRTDSNYVYRSSDNTLHNFKIVCQSKTSNGNIGTNETLVLLLTFFVVVILLILFVLLWKRET